MSASILRRSLAAITVGGALAITAAPAANASPVTNYVADNAHIVCQALDETPTAQEVAIVVLAVKIKTGFSDYDSGWVVGNSVGNYCPEHLNLILAFAEAA